MSDDHDQGDEIKGIDGVFGLSAMKGIALSSENGSFSFVGAGNDSSIILDTKNFALLKAGENCVALYDNGVNGGLVSIQGHDKGAVNLSVQNENKRNTALTITEGEAHLGVFNRDGGDQFDRVHVKQSEIKLQSSKGTIAVPTDQSSLTITPSSIVIKSMNSQLTLEQDGFNLKNAAGTYELKMNSTEFSVTGQGGFLFRIDLANKNVQIQGLEVTINALENEIKLSADKLIERIVALDNRIQGIEQIQSTLSKSSQDAIGQMKAGVQELGS